MYKLINRDNILGSIYSNDDIFMVVHEYLSFILDKLNFMIKVPVISNHRIPIKDLCDSFSGIFIIEIENGETVGDKLFSVVYETIRFNFVIGYFENCSLTREVRNNNVIKYLVDTINTRVESITGQRPNSSLNKINNSNNSNNSNGITNIKPKVFVSEPKSINNVDKGREDEEIFDPLQLEQNISLLLHKKEEEQSKLERMKNYNKDNIEVFNDRCNELHEKQRINTKNKDMDIEKRKIFASDKNSYFLIKKDLHDGHIDSVPELFSLKYDIFKIMDEEGALNLDDEYEAYAELYDDFIGDEVELDKEPINGDIPFISHKVDYVST